MLRQLRLDVDDAHRHGRFMVCDHHEQSSHLGGLPDHKVCDVGYSLDYATEHAVFQASSGVNCFLDSDRRAKRFSHRGFLRSGDGHRAAVELGRFNERNIHREIGSSNDAVGEQKRGIPLP